MVGLCGLVLIPVLFHLTLIVHSYMLVSHENVECAGVKDNEILDIIATLFDKDIKLVKRLSLWLLPQNLHITGQTENCTWSKLQFVSLFLLIMICRHYSKGSSLMFCLFLPITLTWCETGGFHSSEDSSCVLLGCRIPTFQRTVLLPSTGWRWRQHDLLVSCLVPTWCNPEDSDLNVDLSSLTLLKAKLGGDCFNYHDATLDWHQKLVKKMSLWFSKTTSKQGCL